MQLFSKIKKIPNAKLIANCCGEKVEMLQNRLAHNKRLLMKENSKLENLQVEIANVLSGESHFTASDLNVAITGAKNRIRELQAAIIEDDRIVQNEEEISKAILPDYKRFKGWAREFQKMSFERKKVVVSQLVDKVTVKANYEIEIQFNMTYEQFCHDWAENIFNESLEQKVFECGPLGRAFGC